MNIRFDRKVAIITGAGSGLGRCHALGLAARGARVVVNDRGQDGAPPPRAVAVAQEIRDAGGQAIAHGADVTKLDQVMDMVDCAEKAWSGVDILVNNAGILADKSFAKMDMAEFKRVIDVHLIGSANCSTAVWNGMRERGFGRIIFTSSSSGLYGNFGQANYGAAKAAVIGLMNVLHLEGQKYDIRVNALAPMAQTPMTEGLFSEAEAALLSPEAVTPAVLFLASEDAPSRVILGAGGGVFAVTHIAETPGLFFAEGDRTPEAIRAHWQEVSRMDMLAPLHDAFSQSRKYVATATAAS